MKKPLTNGLIMTMKKPKQLYPIAEIIWEDIETQDGGWIKPGHAEIVPCLMTSICYLILDNDQYLVYASDLAQDGTTNGRTQVPKSNVKSIKILKKVPTPRKKKVKSAEQNI